MVALRRDLSALLASAPAWEVAFQPPEWYGDALCAQTSPDEFFPEKGQTTRHAKAICAACPVQQQCLDYALDNNERWGVWGNASERERRKPLRERRRAS